MVAARSRLQRTLAEVRAAGHAVADAIPLGAMIEVPAAALALPDFIGALDFVSVGTNDLVQYLLAVDRNNDALAAMYSPLHPAVIRLLYKVIRTARARGKPVAVCGEMAGDAAFAPLLLALGLEEFSLHPSTLLELRRAIRGCDLGMLRARLPALLRARDRAGIEAWMQKSASAGDNGGMNA
jgi:phosphotransferase system enzyme I (PtsI)